ncbi:polysaccharide deacetylase family protein [Rhodococcus sp. NPDC058514]|uniref:polysaccharide deacetylase family protein n=1 Tax=unclassified Rhodococcus (in: high G+C Gram-positive bacteria) TaxID=192944 RepID=UPI0036541FE2
MTDVRATPNRRTILLGLLGGAASAVSGCADLGGPAVSNAEPVPPPGSAEIQGIAAPVPPPLPPPPPDPATLIAKYAGAVPHEWGLAVTGTRTRLAAAGPRMTLTFDGCGGPRGSAVDAELIALLEREHLPATLFLNTRWIDANRELTDRLAANPLFELANHGTRHLPLSVTGRSAYGIAGTASVSEVIDEVMVNHQRLQEITGVAPRWFRPGTAHCDEVAAAVVRDLGEEVVGFTVNGDFGATASAGHVQSATAGSTPGSIVIMHLNRPHGATAAGLAAALPALRAEGRAFVTLGGAGGLA